MLKKLVQVFNWLVRVYAILSLGLIGLYIYQKYYVKFDDIIEYVPVTFLENSFTNEDKIYYWALVGIAEKNKKMTVRNTLFCKNDAGLWEREVQPDPVTYPLEFSQIRLDIVRDINEQLSIDGKYSYTARNIDIVREAGEEIASNSGWAWAIDYDISQFRSDEPKTCRFKTYYETQTRFFELPKVENYFSHEIQVQRRGYPSYNY